MSKQNENLSKMVQMRFKRKSLFLKIRPPLQGSHSSYESSWREGSVNGSKSLLYSKMNKKTESLSLMVLGDLFGTLCSQCQTAPSEDIFL